MVRYGMVRYGMAWYGMVWHASRHHHKRLSHKGAITCEACLGWAAGGGTLVGGNRRAESSSAGRVVLMYIRPCTSLPHCLCRLFSGTGLSRPSRPSSSTTGTTSLLCQTLQPTGLRALSVEDDPVGCKVWHSNEVMPVVLLPCPEDNGSQSVLHRGASLTHLHLGIQPHPHMVIVVVGLRLFVSAGHIQQPPRGDEAGCRDANVLCLLEQPMSHSSPAEQALRLHT